MTNDERNPKPDVEKLSVVRSPFSSFGFRHSSFGFENCSLFNQKAGQRSGENGRAWVGSWKLHDSRIAHWDHESTRARPRRKASQSMTRTSTTTRTKRRFMEGPRSFFPHAL